jgi:hypothetical protein
LIAGQRLSGFLILGPKPGGYGLFDILQRFFIGLPLRKTAGQSWALGYDPAVFIGL